MTIWARRSLFRELFGEEWDVLLRKEKESVTFIIVAKSDTTIDIDSWEWSHIEDNLTAVGADSVEMFIENGNTGFKVTVPRDNLPEDYDD